ncbi:4-hydroxy-tetrahydrodipicolinate synthase [Telmatospirillum sp.]|uniref:4-hydroxy-tetrahydrodipicolinate synthase n=1 Tax=Telmatospirillum sp. TaxID=2079197 RepID=UPI00284C3E65|nr:4-hydroxy-tetrahydrodipicolinate synthase [Telmatospirillum sp.]MDR3438493.1 4-hydroxy-tetrahydrodipicolinate synthase [Telmatospirillum sp.]
MTSAQIKGVQGSIAALVTPFRDGLVDEPAFRFLCERQIERGTSALVVCGTTGEAPTLDRRERTTIIRLAVDVAARRVPVVAGVGSNCTASAIDQAYQAEWLGADGLLCVVPYYNRPTQEGLFRHFLAVQSKTCLPVLLYDVPARTGAGLTIETIVRLSQLPNIAGLKDASGDLDRMAQLRRHLGPDFLLLSGDDATAAAALELGSQGCISVSANVAPALCAALHRSWIAQDLGKFRFLRDLLAPLATALFIESNPIAVKWALARLGVIQDELRLPLTPLSLHCEAVVRQALDGIVFHEAEEAARVPFPRSCLPAATAA